MDIKDFDAWGARKKAIHAQSHGPNFYHTREVWWCSIGINIGVEMDGKHASHSRPVLVLRRFNKHMFWGIPFTTATREGYSYFRVAHIGGPSWAILNQLRIFSSKRLLRRIDTITVDQFDEIRVRVISLLESRNPLSS